jgi:hypothetical protein
VTDCHFQPRIGNGALDPPRIAVHTFGMTLPRDRLAYSSPFTRPPLKLPGNARMIVWSVVNIEEWEITRPMARQLSQPPTG